MEPGSATLRGAGESGLAMTVAAERLHVVTGRAVRFRAVGLWGMPRDEVGRMVPFRPDLLRRVAILAEPLGVASDARGGFRGGRWSMDLGPVGCVDAHGARRRGGDVWRGRPLGGAWREHGDCGATRISRVACDTGGLGVTDRATCGIAGGRRAVPTGREIHQQVIRGLGAAGGERGHHARDARVGGERGNRSVPRDVEMATRTTRLRMTNRARGDRARRLGAVPLQEIGPRVRRRTRQRRDLNIGEPDGAGQRTMAGGALALGSEMLRRLVGVAPDAGGRGRPADGHPPRRRRVTALTGGLIPGLGVVRGVREDQQPHGACRGRRPGPPPAACAVVTRGTRRRLRKNPERRGLPQVRLRRTLEPSVLPGSPRRDQG